jgi:hypothetical protein
MTNALEQAREALMAVTFLDRTAMDKRGVAQVPYATLAKCAGAIAAIDAAIAASQQVAAQASPAVAPMVLALHFHEAYERLAPSFGYETRTETRKFDPSSQNAKLMEAVCAEILRWLAPQPAQQDAPGS